MISELEGLDTWIAQTSPAFLRAQNRCARLTWTADGRISYQLKRPWPDGRTHLVLEPVAFLRRLVGIIPPPRRHLVRYAGVFGPVVAFVADATRARSLLTTIGLPAEPATFAPTRDPPQAELIWQDPP